MHPNSRKSISFGVPFGACRSCLKNNKSTVSNKLNSASDKLYQDSVNCAGDEKSFKDCDYELIDNCDKYEGAGVICKQKNLKVLIIVKLSKTELRVIKF